MRRWILRLVAAALLLPLVLVLLYRVLPVPMTPLMVLRSVSGYGQDGRWVDYDEMPAVLRKAVVAAEDARFCEHDGFDWEQIEAAWAQDRHGGRLRGGSTITQQTAKNLMLWPGRDWLRKGLEVYPTALMELFWPKRRILQVYLNIIEWGPGIYGVEAAAHRYFGHGAKDLSPREAALLAASIPGPLHWRPDQPTAYLRQRAEIIRSRIADTPSDCL